MQAPDFGIYKPADSTYTTNHSRRHRRDLKIGSTVTGKNSKSKYSSAGKNYLATCQLVENITQMHQVLIT